MRQIDHLTNERLRSKFDNQFELVNYAIRLAEHYIKSGKEPFVGHEPRNLSSQILEIIESGKEVLAQLPDERAVITHIETRLLETGKRAITEELIQETIIIEDATGNLPSNENEAVEAV